MSRRFLGYTWVGWLNLLVLQWLWMRLTWVFRRTEGRIRGEFDGYGLMFPVVPATGWVGRSYFPVMPRIWRLFRRLPDGGVAIVSREAP